MKKTIVSLLMAGSMAATAGTPVFYFTALTDTDIKLGRGEIKQVIYQVRNQSIKAHNLQMRKIVGITELPGEDTCAEKGRLEAGQHCLLKLEINGRTFKGLDDVSPRVCADGTVLMCYTPNEAQQLRVTING